MNKRSDRPSESPPTAVAATNAQPHDISRRERTEEDLRNSEWRLRYATESARLTYLEVDIAAGMVWTSENFATVMGYATPPGQEVDVQAGSRLLLEHVVLQDRPRVSAALEEFIAGKSAGKLEYRVRGDDQVERWIETRWSIELAADGTPLKSFATNLDITERRRTEDEIRDSEERYRTLFNSIDEGFCVIEMIFDDHGRAVDYRFLEVNPSFETLTGVHESVGKRMRELAPDHEAYWFETYGKVALTGEPIRFVHEAKALDGRCFDFYAFRIGGADSRKVAVLFTNITERKHTEQALLDSEERYRTLFNSIDQGFCLIEMIFDDHGRAVDYRFLEVNPTFEKQSGLVGAAGKRVRELIPALEAHWFETYGKVARTGETARFVSLVKDLGDRWFDVYACQVGGADSRKVAVVFNDITARKQLDEALQVNERQLRFVLDSMPQKVATATPDGAHDYFNPQWSEFTGLSFDQIKGWGWKQFIHPDDLAETIRIWQHSLATGEASQSEQRFRRDDGAYHWHLTRSVPIRDAAGEVALWIGSSTDVQDVKEADRHKDEFLAMLAHELRNPLAPIRNMVEVIKRADGNRDLLQPALAVMDRQLRQMTRLIDDLLDVGRISQGKIELRREAVDVASVIRQALEASSPASDAARQDVSVTLPAQPLYVDADPARLAQVLGNLLHNASKFSKPGGRIALLAERQGADVVVTVTDAGIGIAAGTLPNIFEMFAQGDESLERTNSGLGIGLTLVRRLIEMHGGSVQASSEGVGRGSAFMVRLPELISQGERLPPDVAVDGFPHVTGRRILVVDDNHDSADSLCLLLQLTGNQTHAAFDGVEAVAAAARFKPDVIVMDIGLPNLNGYEAARQIREQPWGKTLFLVALTGWGLDEDRKKTADAGFDAHLVKPVDYAVLEELLAGVVVPGGHRDHIETDHA